MLTREGLSEMGGFLYSLNRRKGGEAELSVAHCELYFSQQIEFLFC